MQNTVDRLTSKPNSPDERLNARALGLSGANITPKEVRSLIWRIANTQTPRVPLGEEFSSVAAITDKQLSGDAGHSANGEKGMKVKQKRRKSDAHKQV
jgi:hypothetical protein